MGNLLLKAVPALLLLLAAACETTGGVQPAQARPASGQHLYERSCARCHALYMPRSYSAGEWRFFVRKYGRKARLSKQQRQLVYGYLSERARAG